MTLVTHDTRDTHPQLLPKHLVIPNIFTNFASMNLNSMMRHHTYTPKSLEVSGLRLIGG